MAENCTNLTVCVEALLDEARLGSSSSVVALRGLHETYGKGKIIDDEYDISLVPCPLRRCDRDRFLIFYDDDTAVTTDDGYPTECVQGHKTVTINPAPTDIVDQDPPKPPEPPLSLGA